jgi:hypothetical protein
VFSGCWSLYSISIPATVRKIGISCFPARTIVSIVEDPKAAEPDSPPSDPEQGESDCRPPPSPIPDRVQPSSSQDYQSWYPINRPARARAAASSTCCLLL